MAMGTSGRVLSMPRSAYPGEVHLHIGENKLFDLIEQELGIAIPFCRANMTDGCFRGTAEAIRFGLCVVLSYGRPDREPVLPSMPEITDASSFVTGVAAVSRWLAEPAVDDVSLQAGVTFSLVTLDIILDGGTPPASTFRDMWFDVAGKSLIVKAVNATAEDVLADTVRQAKELHALALREERPGIFSFFPSTRQQAAFDRVDSPIRDRVLGRLSEMHDGDGQFIRSDDVFLSVVAEMSN